MPGLPSIDLKPEHVPRLTVIPNPEINVEKINSFVQENPKNEIEMQVIKITESEHTNLNHLTKAKKQIQNSLELKWENITITTKPGAGKCLKKSTSSKRKTLLSNVSGSVKTGEALAIIGGSGAGKTTLLNFLSKKIETADLNYSGKISLNNIEVLSDDTTQDAKDYFKASDLVSICSYVMQDDILEATMTPLEILLFTAKLKLNLPEAEIEKKVNLMLSELNLQNCKNTRIGNNLIRGVSGGERKRTSIGVELISDPKIVFLDEPTTGLDSYNAFEVVQNLCELAQLEEKIIIFTIHQPSSEIFSLLHKVFILADGKTVYFGDRENSIDFFNDHLRLPYPGNYNPFEYFIEMTNFEVLNNNKVKAVDAYGLLLSVVEGQDDEARLKAYSDYIQMLADIFAGKKKLVLGNEDYNGKGSNYVLVEDNSGPFNANRSRKNKELGHSNTKHAAAYERVPESYSLKKAYEVDSSKRLFDPAMLMSKERLDEIIASKGNTRGFFFEFSMLYGRNTVCSSRNSNVLGFSIANNLIVGIFAAILFKNLTKNLSGIQDRSGLILLMVAHLIFSTGTSTILVFSEERKVFLRERSNKLYSVFAYFIAKVLSEIPIFFISTCLFFAIVYPSTNLNDTYSSRYYVLGGVLMLAAFVGASYSFFLGSMVSNQEALTNINQVFTVPLLLLSGFFASSDNFAPYLLPFEYISGFKYTFQVLIENEFRDMQPLNCANSMSFPCEPLRNNFTFREDLWLSVLCLALLVIFFKTVAFIITYFRSKIKA